MRSEQTRFKERTPWPGWANAIFWGSILVCCYPLIAGWDTDMEFLTRLMIVSGIMTFAVGMKLLLGGLNVLVQESRLYLYMGSVPVIKKVIPYSDIQEIESVRYSPMREFGGWGLRGFGKKKAWTASGDEAVVLSLPNDHLLYVGSAAPRRLEERIRSAIHAHEKK